MTKGRKGCASPLALYARILSKEGNGGEGEGEIDRGRERERETETMNMRARLSGNPTVFLYMINM